MPEAKDNPGRGHQTPCSDLIIGQEDIRRLQQANENRKEELRERTRAEIALHQDMGLLGDRIRALTGQLEGFQGWATGVVLRKVFPYLLGFGIFVLIASSTITAILFRDLRSGQLQMSVDIGENQAMLGDAVKRLERATAVSEKNRQILEEQFGLAAGEKP